MSKAVETVPHAAIEGELEGARSTSVPAQRELPSDKEYSILSRLTLLWTVPMLTRGWHNKLAANTIPRLDERFHAEKSLQDFTKLWAEEKKKEKPSLMRILAKLPMGGLLVWASLFGCLQGLSMTVLRPIVLRQLIIICSSPQFDSSAAILWLSVFVFTLVLETMFLTWVQHAFSEQFGTSLISTLSVIIQNKSIALAPGQGGNETGLVGSDIIRQFHFLLQIGFLPSSFAALIAGFVMLLVLIGWQGMVGFVFMMFVSGFCFWLSTQSKKEARNQLQQADKRLSLMKQLITGIKAVKFSAWEEKFRERLDAARVVECDHIKKYRQLAVASSSFGRSAPILAAAISFVCMGFTRDSLKAEDIYAAYAVFLALRMPMILLPMGITFFMSLQVSMKRLQKYLMLPERKVQRFEPNTYPDQAIVIRDTTFQFLEQAKQDKGQKNGNNKKSKAVTISPAESGDNSNTFSLRVDKLDIAHGSCTAIVGAVGSGKSALLASILGDMRGSERVVCNAAKEARAYVPQKAIVITGTVRDNVVMGKPFDANLYHESIKIADMGTDLDELPDGDQTVVGERGVTLSGGQQQRLAIARAMYHEPQLLILDDPLAAVDAVVASNIFSRLLEWRAHRQALGQPCTIVMALNQLHLLQSFERIVFLDTPGHLRESSCSDYHSLVRDNTAFNDLMAMYAHQHEENVDNINSDDSKAAVAERKAKEDAKVEVAHSLLAAQIAGQGKRGKEDRELGRATSQHQLVKTEHKQDGAIKGNTYKQFFGAFGSMNIFLSVSTGVIGYALMLFGDFWLARWLKDEEGLTDHSKKSMYLWTYLAAAALHCIFVQGLSHFYLEGCVRASKTLHHDTVNHLLHAPISWFEATPSGRILSRFSTDLNVIDILLGTMSDPFIQLLLMCMAFIIGMLVVVPYLLVVVVIAVAVLYMITTYVEKAVLELKRMTNNAMSPVMTNMAEVQASRLLCHTMQLRPLFMKRQYDALDQYNRINYCTYTLVNWMKMTTQLICAAIAVATAVWIVTNRSDFVSTSSDADKNGEDSGMIGVSLTYALTMPMLFAFVVTLKSQLATHILSVERLLEYSPSTALLPQEAEWEAKDDQQLIEAQQWPSAATVEFRDVSLVYRPGLPPALHGVTLCFEGRKHTGVIGRTGAGKSSLLVLLFRLNEAATGKVLIDGVDVSTVGLITLRKRMAIIPQHPLLLQGTVQHNLDPFGEFKRDHLESVLTRVGLYDHHAKTSAQKSLGDTNPNVEIVNGNGSSNSKASADGSGSGSGNGLTSGLGDGNGTSDVDGLAQALNREVSSGVGLSAGEQQLLSFARALLRIESGQVRLTIMDEPTANIDMATDDSIQRLVRSALQDLTVITIAHRLNTVIDFDKILVMEAGSVAEYGAPLDLLADPASHLSTTVQAMGKQAADKLIEKAKRAKSAKASFHVEAPRPVPVLVQQPATPSDSPIPKVASAAPSTPAISANSFTAHVTVPPSAKGGDLIKVTSPDGSAQIAARLPQHSVPGDTVVLRVQSQDEDMEDGSVSSLPPRSPIPGASSSVYSTEVAVPAGAKPGDTIAIPPPENDASLRITARIPAGSSPGDRLLLSVRDGMLLSVESVGNAAQHLSTV